MHTSGPRARAEVHTDEVRRLPTSSAHKHTRTHSSAARQTSTRPPAHPRNLARTLLRTLSLSHPHHRTPDSRPRTRRQVRQLWLSVLQWRSLRQNRSYCKVLSYLYIPDFPAPMTQSPFISFHPSRSIAAAFGRRRCDADWCSDPRPARSAHPAALAQAQDERGTARLRPLPAQDECVRRGDGRGGAIILLYYYTTTLFY